MASKLTYKAKANAQDIVRYIRSHYSSQDKRPKRTSEHGEADQAQLDLIDFDIGPCVEAR